jgi:hypothetical protein
VYILETWHKFEAAQALSPLRGKAHRRNNAQSLNDGEREEFAPRIFFSNLNWPWRKPDVFRILKCILAS